MNNFVVSLSTAIFLTACTKPLKPNTSTIVLLKNSKAHNAIIFSSSKGEQKLDKPREFISINKKDTEIEAPKRMSQKELKKRFGDVLSIKIPKPKSYILYLKKGQMELTHASKKRIPNIIDMIIDRVPATVDIIGHTDSVGSEESNRKISLKEARFVRTLFEKEILKVLIGAMNIRLESKGYGEVDQLIPTANNVAEERNRNIEVVVK